MRLHTFALLLMILCFMNANPARADDGSVEEQQAIAKLKQLGRFTGFIHTVDEKKPGKPVVTVRIIGPEVTAAAFAEIKAFKQLRELTLNDTAVSGAAFSVLRELPLLEEVTLVDDDLTDEVIDHLRVLPRLRKLHFSKTTDQTMKRLGELKSLRSLSLWETKISDAGLAAYQPPSDLEELNLGVTRVTDEGLRHVGRIKSLRSLSLRYTDVTDAGLKSLRDLPQLEELDLCTTKITDVGLVELRSLPNLKELWLGSTAIDDAGLQVIKELTGLKTLDLSGTKVTDKGLKQLERMEGLTSLSFHDTDVSDEAEAELVKKLPILAKAREEERRRLYPKREQKPPTGVSEADARVILDEVIRQLLTEAELKSIVEDYGTRGAKRLALVSDSPIAWPKDFKPALIGYEFPSLAERRERPRSERKQPAVAGVRIDKFDLAKKPEELLDGHIDVCIFTAGGGGTVIGGCSIYFNAEKKNGKWVVTCTGFLDP